MPVPAEPKWPRGTRSAKVKHEAVFRLAWRDFAMQRLKMEVAATATPLVNTQQRMLANAANATAAIRIPAGSTRVMGRLLRVLLTRNRHHLRFGIAESD